MTGTHQPLLGNAYLRSLWAKDFEEFIASKEEEILLDRLKNWAEKDWQKETGAESAFVDIFFKKIWGYQASGEGDKKSGYTLYPQYPVKGAGQRGGTGQADIALGYFGGGDGDGIPQLLGEFKDDRSGLDKPQKGRPNNRSPVDQCLDYLREARRGLISPILPTWGLATDMNEFRLYAYGNKTQYQRFIINVSGTSSAIALLDDNEEAAFQRFLFYRMLQPEWILSIAGKSKLEKLLNGQLVYEQSLENDFYAEYHNFRETIYKALREHNPKYEEENRLWKLVKYTQRFLDRCLFILYCEDMGRELDFPPNVLRDLLIYISNDQYYDSEGANAWYRVKQLFVSMRDGTPFGSERINRFNGGLFAEDLEMDALVIPNRIFCRHNQGQAKKQILEFPDTLLYFSAKYNFGESDNGEGRTLSLTAMGRIFEQSITDLEVMEAHAQGRESLVEITKRKRDGVYYTPEWVTYYIVENTVGTRLTEIREELGFASFVHISDEDIMAHRSDGRKEKIVSKYERALLLYSDRMDTLRVVDPACGSGAFLVQAFRYLLEQRQWISAELTRVTGEQSLFDTSSAIRSVLSQNIYGVDINAESVEITKLTLWLNTALKDQPLTSLDENIRCGNSLVGTDFFEQLTIDSDSYEENEYERVNPFDWKEAFPEIFGGEDPGFDCVVGNPPYVKLQHFRKIQEDVAQYLIDAKLSDGSLLYESTQTGSFDMYLPFIERGIEFLNRQGKMGYIAPNVWLLNDYGKGLRKKIKRQQTLERWVDFKSFQVFEDATTYTALQFFTRSENNYVSCVFAPNGEEDIVTEKWSDVSDKVFYQTLADEESWALMSNKETKLLDRVNESCSRLDESSKGIMVGIQTSADYIYHLEYIGQNLYRYKTKDKKETIEVEIEDEIMHPLVSGAEAKRYKVPITTTYLIFPYENKDGRVQLMSESTIQDRFPKAWTYLKKYEEELRNRENGKMNNDNSWWAYNYPKNLDKQELAKLCVAQTVPGMRVFYDAKGEFYLNNVRVNGIIFSDNDTGWFLLGVLNAPVCDYVFKRIAKAKSGGYYEANKQFIAPLPIPKVNNEEKNLVIEKAKRLQDLHTNHRDKILAIDERLDSPQCENDIRDEGWLWADVKSVSILKKEAPNELKGRELTAWARKQRELKLMAHYDMIDAMLRPRVNLSVDSAYGELKILVNGISLISGIYLSEEEVDFVSAQWRQKLRRTNVTEKFDAKRLIKLLLNLRKTQNKVIEKQVVSIDREIQELDIVLENVENDMNKLTYKLYDLTEEEIEIVEEDRL